MTEFLQLISPDTALSLLIDNLPKRQEVSEKGLVVDGVGKILAKSITSTESLPAFPRSTVDGYAVIAVDTHGAGESLPVYLNLIGEVTMGKEPSFCVKSGETARVFTGGMLPAGANAVVMVEDTQLASNHDVEIVHAVAIGENTLQVGEDIHVGEIVFDAGVVLGPSEIGALSALGVIETDFVASPRVAVISSGDELIEPSETPQTGQVRDINSYSLCALLKMNGAVPVRYGISHDNIQEFQKMVSKAISECDMVIITAGSSASSRDLTATIIDHLGNPGVLVHGINIRPGKPTVLGVCDEKPVIGLPGNPVSALVVAERLVIPVINHLCGIAKQSYRPSIIARMTSNIPSKAGREEWIPVRIEEENNELKAIPIFYKSNLIFTLARADGMVKIDSDTTGLAANETVRVYLK